jgi:hypothetical protein
MQMMRARATLFGEQKTIEGKSLLAYEIEEVYHDRNAIKLKSMTPKPVPPAFIKNRAITQMREEIQKGASWLKDFCWALRYCESVTDPFVISELPFSLGGRPYPPLSLCEAIETGLAEALPEPQSIWRETNRLQLSVGELY